MGNTGQSKKVSGRPSLEQAVDMKTNDQIGCHAPSPAPSEDGKALSPHEIKRRAQNRASQRAFRERKRTQAETLQKQVNEMRQMHEELLSSYHHKEEEVSELYNKIHDLEYRIQALKQSPSPQQLSSASSFQFEPVVFDDPFDEWSTASLQTPVEWSTQSQQPVHFF